MDKKKCVNYHEDGCGHYCKAININALKESGRITEDYPHKYWRVHCFNDRNSCPFKRLYMEQK